MDIRTWATWQFLLFSINCAPLSHPWASRSSYAGAWWVLVCSLTQDRGHWCLEGLCPPIPKRTIGRPHSGMLTWCRKGQVYVVSPSGMGCDCCVATTNGSFCQEVERLDGWSCLHYTWPYFFNHFSMPLHQRFHQFFNVALSTKLKLYRNPFPRQRKPNIMNNRRWKWCYCVPTVVTEAFHHISPLELSDV